MNTQTNAVGSELPAPPVPPTADLRGFAFMQIDVRRLLGSDTWLTGTGDERAAAVTLLLESWHQTPAGSLPSDERALARLSQAGAAWKRVRAHALRGWRLHSDGRLYHHVVAEKVVAAVEAQARNARRRESDGARLQRWRDQKRAGKAQETADETRFSERFPSRGEGEGEGKGESESSLRSASARSVEHAAVDAPQEPMQGTLILPIAGAGPPADDESDGQRIRREQGGEARRILRLVAPRLAPERVGELLGAWCKALHGDRALLIQVLRDAERQAAAERIVGHPTTWIWGLVRQRATQTRPLDGASSHAQHDPAGAPRRTYGGDPDSRRRGILAALAGELEGDGHAAGVGT